MPMADLHTCLPDIAEKETRTVTVLGRSDLPDGQYAFLEMYCNEVACDCRRVLIQVISAPPRPRILATINYGWETAAFYANWIGDPEAGEEAQGASLDPLGMQSQYSSTLLELFKFVLQDEQYVERLRQHYALFKSRINEKKRATARSANPHPPKRQRPKRR
jgi:hypothetical protein